MEFMLAERGRHEDLGKLAATGYVFDLKIDGIRAFVRTDGTPAVVMTSRNDLDLTARFPELVTALRALNTPGVTLDAEIAVPDSSGLPSWPLTQRRTAQRSAPGRMALDLPAVLYVFDVLELDGTDTTTWPFRQRRAALEELATRWDGRLSTTVCSPDPWSLWQLVREHHLEGLIAKRGDSRYHRGRSRDWIKIKATQTLSALVGGVEWAGAEGTSEPRSTLPRGSDRGAGAGRQRLGGRVGPDAAPPDRRTSAPPGGGGGGVLGGHRGWGVAPPRRSGRPLRHRCAGLWHRPAARAGLDRSREIH